MVISIANQKGGVGKTTTAVNLSASIAVSEHKSLIIDMDSQCNTTSGFGISYSNVAGNIYRVLVGENSINEVIRQTAIPYLDIVPAHPDLIGAEILDPHRLPLLWSPSRGAQSPWLCCSMGESSGG